MVRLPWNRPETAASLLALTARESASAMPTQPPLQNQPDPGRVIPHLAVRALVALEAVDACLAALDGPYVDGALWALRDLHRPAAVDGLIQRLRTARDPQLRRGILVTLMRLYYREADYDGSWWGIRPDSTGPYYDRTEWEQTSRIHEVLATAMADADAETAADLKRELRRHGLPLGGGDAVATGDMPEDRPIVLPQADPANPHQIGNMTLDAAATRALAAEGDPERGAELFKAQSCVACHTTADGQTPKGPHLFEIGKRYKPAELVESILQPSAKLAQGYEMYQFVTAEGRVFQGFVVSERAAATVIRETDGPQRVINKREIELKQIQKLSAMPAGLVANLTPEQLADLIAYLQSLK